MGTPSRQRRGRGRASSTPMGARDAFASVIGALPERTRVVLLVFAAIAAAFFLRLIFLQVIVADQYSAMAEESRTVSFETSPRRGTIYDRNGIVLATSVEATTIYANPVEVSNAVEEARQLADVLGGEADDYQDLLATPSTTFVYIKRQADVDKDRKSVV